MARVQTDHDGNVRVLVPENARSLPTRRAVPDVDESHYAGFAGGGKNRLPIVVKRRIIEVDVGIDNSWPRSIRCHLTVTLLARLRGRSGSVPRANAA